jgi:4-azaleucine resistance transporter AzlC
MTVPFTRRGIANGARQALPLAASSFPYSLIFGTLAQTAGLQLAETALMSATVCAGAAQFVVIGLWTTPPVLTSVLAATLLVNLRHLLLGATLRGWFAGTTRPQLYGSAFFLFDETWALTHREADTNGRDRGFLLGCGLVLWFGWTTGSTLGYLVGDLVPDPTRWGLDFAATAVFLAHRHVARQARPVPLARRGPGGAHRRALVAGPVVHPARWPRREPLRGLARCGVRSR